MAKLIKKVNSSKNKKPERFKPHTELTKEEQRKQLELNEKRNKTRRTQSHNRVKNKKPHGFNDIINHFGYTFGKSKKAHKKIGSTFNLYTTLFTNWLRKGWQKSNIPDHNIPFNKIYCSSDKIYTTNEGKKPIVLKSWETNSMPIGWVDIIREDLSKLESNYNTAHHTNYIITLNYLQDCTPSKIKNFSNNKRYQNSFDSLRRQYERNLLSLDDESISKAQKQANLGQEMYTRLMTYEWLMDLEEDEQSSLWDSYEILEVIIENGEPQEINELFEKAYHTVIERLNYFKINSKDLMLEVQGYYDDQSFIGHDRKKQSIKRDLPCEVRNGDYLSASNVVQEGNISDLVGVPVGIDILNEKPVFIDYTDNNLSPNQLITAMTGEGKTFLVQTLIVALLQFPQLYFTLVVDFKNEYKDLAKKLGMQFISVAPSDGVYIDTMVVPSPTGDEEIDLELKDDAFRDTEEVFSVLLGEAWEDLDIRSAFNYVRSSLYRKRGFVANEPETWSNTKGLTFQSFYDEIGNVLNNEPTQAKESAGGSLKAYHKMKQILSDYFEIDGSKNSYFQHAISLDDIDESTGVIFGLGQNVSTGMNNQERLLLSIIFIMHLLKALIFKMKKQKRLLMTFFEETNQLLLLPHIAEMLSRFASGGRSFGMRNFFITNAPEQIFDAKELNSKENKNVDLSAISALSSNIGGCIVGALRKEAMLSVVRTLLQGHNNLENFVKMLINEANSNGKTALKHTFLILHRNKTALIQALANPVLVDQGLFGTEIKANSRYDKDITLDDLLNAENEKTFKKYSKTIHDKSNSIHKNKINRQNVWSEQSQAHTANKMNTKHSPTPSFDEIPKPLSTGERRELSQRERHFRRNGNEIENKNDFDFKHPTNGRNQSQNANINRLKDDGDFRF